jgi:hypothetical protein
MRPRILGLAFALTMFAFLLPLAHSLQAQEGTPPPGGPPGGPPPGGPGGPGEMRPRPTPAQMAAMRDTVTNMLLSRIAGKENAPAESVFKNIKVMKGIPAGRFLNIMNKGFGNSLGVGCGHCHVMGGKWDSDDKKNKQIARDMWQMTGTINNDLLAKIPNLDEDNRVVNCTTCHRGDTTPATQMPSPVPAH